ncbi:hypothetical protein BDZ90DRAFT_257349 [Jaminaea rosea]|uniref:PX domain-containing protein n=1 Tax=Jaminaea rosea TaxID=1569628 RepID=A0A316UYH0_9BASI|nr:hypothetical protein BDZ90DRAFT_257349 [Jaminaea rosea]PWN30262.1 hypothetical protein BDZ90DRAFT_257349 [Jaminaea rosea]
MVIPAAAATRPPRPPKPSHLSVALTGTLNSEALRTYIRAQATGSSIAGFSTIGTKSTQGSDDDDEDADQWMTARPPHTPIKTTPLESLFGDDGGQHHRSFSSIPTVKGRPVPSVALAEDDVAEDDALAYASIPEAPLHSRTSTDASFATIKPASSSSGQQRPALRPESLVPGMLLAWDTGTTSNGSSPHVHERSRAPSVLSAGGDEGMRFSQWDMQGPAANGKADAVNQEQEQDNEVHGSMPPESMAAQATEEPQPTEEQLTSNSSAETTSEMPIQAEPVLAVASPSVDAPAATSFYELPDAPAPSTSANPLPAGRPARALFAIQGEAAFNELTLSAGQTFNVLNDDLQGGWSLAVVPDQTTPDGWRRGLVPNGWYAFEREMLPPPAVDVQEAATTISSKAEQGEEDHSSYLAAPSIAATALYAEGQLHSPTGQEQDLSPEALSEQMSASRPAERSRATLALSQLVPPPSDHGRVRSYDGRSDDSGRAGSLRGIPSMPAIDRRGDDLDDNDRASSSSLPSRPTPSLIQPFSRSFNRFSPFVSSGAEAYLLSPDDVVNYHHHQHREQQRSGSSSDSSSSPSVLHLRHGSSPSSRSSEIDPTTAAVRYEVETSLHGELRWREKVARFWVEVHSAHYFKPKARRRGWLMDSEAEGFVVFQVATRFISERGGVERENEEYREAAAPPPSDPEWPSEEPVQVLTVSRRFQHFVWLAAHLAATYPIVALPPLPAKSRSRRFDRGFIEERRKVLSTFLERVARHPLLRQDEAIVAFLTSGAVEESGDDDVTTSTNEESLSSWEEWVKDHVQQQALTSSATTSAVPGADLFARSLHPEFAIDAEDVEVEWTAAERWASLAEEGVASSHQDALLETMRRFRNDVSRFSEGYRSLGRSLLKLTTLSDGDTAATSNKGMRSPRRPCWCWRPACTSCSVLTTCLQKTADALQDVGAIQDNQARSSLLALHERLWSISRPHAVHADLFDVGRETLSRYELARNADAAAALTQHQRAASSSNKAGSTAKLPVETAELLASKAETVLNVAMAELECVHSDKIEDWAKVGRDVLDSQIEMHRAALERLEAAREEWTDEAWREKAAQVENGQIREASPYLEDLKAARAAPPAPLPQPTASILPPGVIERGILRPVGLAGDYVLSVMGLGSHAAEFNETG